MKWCVLRERLSHVRMGDEEATAALSTRAAGPRGRLTHGYGAPMQRPPQGRRGAGQTKSYNNVRKTGKKNQSQKRTKGGEENKSERRRKPTRRTIPGAFQTNEHAKRPRRPQTLPLAESGQNVDGKDHKRCVCVGTVVFGEKH